MDGPPDLRDGLTSVQRRCLARLGGRYVRSATVVEDEDEYDALVRLAQDFRVRYPLVDGRGNFGSVDDDPPADAIYTEVRLMPLAGELARFPNLLVNGSATFPSHNLREVAAAVGAFLDDPDIDVRGLMAHLPGPDLPTGGVIVGDGIREAYETGRGEVRVRGRAHVEDGLVIVTELPPEVPKGGEHGIIRAIVELMFERRLPELRDVQDHTDARGMRLKLEISDLDRAPAFLDTLYERTALETALPVDLVALVDGEPRRLTLPELIRRFVGAHDPATLRGQLDAIARRHGDPRRTTL